MIQLKRFALAVLIIALAGTACASAETTTIQGSLERDIPFQTSYEANPVIPGESATTGLPFDGTYVPLLVVYDNAQKARPLVGIAQADIVYQFPNAGAGATKLLGLFADSIPKLAGNVRSARVPFIELREIYDSALIYSGGPTDEVRNDINIRVSLRGFDLYQKGLSFNIISGQQKYADREEGKGKYYNTMGMLQTIRDLLIADGMQFTEKPFRFTDELPTGGTAATDIEIAHFSSKTGKDQGNPASWARYLYDADANAYARMVDTGVFADFSDPDTALTYTNLIVMRCRYRFLGNYVLLPALVGEGPAEIFIGGRYIAGGWVHSSLDSQYVFVDENGQEISLQRGNIFIVVGNEATRVTYSDGE